MSIIYGLSIILLITLLIIVEKSKEKLDIAKTITFIFTSMIAYNCFICYLLNLINIPITLINLSIINLIFIIMIFVKIIKDKKIQSYTLNKSSIVLILIFSIFVVIITNVCFDNITKLRYVSMDSKEHYKAAREFSENIALSNKATENNTSSNTFLPMAYTNVGILFKVLNPFIATVRII